MVQTFVRPIIVKSYKYIFKFSARNRSPRAFLFTTGAFASGAAKKINIKSILKMCISRTMVCRRIVRDTTDRQMLQYCKVVKKSERQS
jgi:hypothetical protein